MGPKRKPRNDTELIITVFLLLISTVLILLTLAAISVVLFTDKDVTVFFEIIIEMMKTLIAALVGFLAGKASSTDGEE